MSIQGQREGCHGAKRMVHLGVYCCSSMNAKVFFGKILNLELFPMGFRV